jgi:hypothetical protein
MPTITSYTTKCDLTLNTIHRRSGDKLFRLTFTCPPRHGQVVAVNADDHPARASCV